MDRKVNKYIIQLVASLLLILVLALPLLFLAVRWLTSSDPKVLFSFINVTNLQLISKSFLISIIVAILSTAIGTACGFILYKLKFSYSGFYKLILLLPLLISPYIFAVAWKDGFFWFFGNAASLFSEAGVIIVHSFVFFPLAMLITGSALSQIDKGYEEAGLMIMSFRGMVFRIILKLIRPAITLSFLLILIFSLSDFSVPAFFGVRTFTTEIFTQFSAFYNFPMALGLSALLLLICFLLLMVEARNLSEAPFFSISTKGSISIKYDVRGWTLLLHGTFWLLVIFVLLMPIFILVVQSMSGKELYFIQAFELMLMPAFQSIKLAFAGALLITVIGFWAAHEKERKGYKFPNFMLLLIFIVPSTVLGIALIKYYNLPSLNFIYGTSLILIIAYVGKFGFIISRIIGNGIKQIPVSFEEAAYVMGIPSYKILLKIRLPLMIPSLFTAFVLAFILCIGELGATMLVYPPGMELMPVKTFTISANAPQALTSSMTLVNLGVTLLIIMLFFILGKRIFNKFQYV